MNKEDIMNRVKKILATILTAASCLLLIQVWCSPYKKRSFTSCP